MVAQVIVRVPLGDVDVRLPNYLVRYSVNADGWAVVGTDGQLSKVMTRMKRSRMTMSSLTDDYENLASIVM